MLKNLISKLQDQLKENAQPQVKEWFEKYLKGTIKYYGVKTPEVKNIVKNWNKNSQINKLNSTQQIKLCQELMSLNYAEEKFSAIIYIELFLIKSLNINSLLKLAQWFFENNCFYDWSTADWFTVRVLNNIIKKDKKSLETIMSWAKEKSLWQRRASIVALRTIVKEGQYFPLIEKAVTQLVKEKERFIQTGIGWTISDLAKIFPNQSAYLVEKYFEHLSKEVIDRHTKYLPKHKEYKKKKRKQK